MPLPDSQAGLLEARAGSTWNRAGSGRVTTRAVEVYTVPGWVRQWRAIPGHPDLSAEVTGSRQDFAASPKN